MEKSILNEINDIRRVMRLPLISEETLLTNTPLLTEGYVNDIMKDLLAPASRGFIRTGLSAVERGLLLKYLKSEIKTSAEKIKFADFVKSQSGKTAIAEIKAAVRLARQNKKLSYLGEKYWNTLLKNMEKKGTEWKPLVPNIKDAAEKLKVPHNVNIPIKNSSEFFTVLATDKTIFNEIRKSLSFFKEQLTTKIIGVEKQLDKIMLNLESAITNKSLNAEISKTQIRQLGLQIMGLKKTANQQYNTILNEIETAVINLKNANGKPLYNVKDVREIVAKLREQSAFKDIFKTPKPTSDFWLWDKFTQSSYANTLRNIRDIVKTKGKTIMTLLHRALMFLTTGHVRTFSEITEFCIEEGFTAGMAKYFAWLYTMKYFIMPTMAGVKDLGWASFKQLLGDPDYTEDDFNTMVNKYYLDPLTKNFTERDVVDKINPFDWMWDNLGRGADKNAQEKIYEEFVLKLDIMAEKWGLTKEELEIVKLRVKNATNPAQAIEEIKKTLDENGNLGQFVNTQAGFILWCKTQKPPLTPDPSSPWIKEPMPGLEDMPDMFNEYGLTEDGKKWAYDPKEKTFIPYG
jgi:hypothetical protein